MRPGTVHGLYDGAAAPALAAVQRYDQPTDAQFRAPCAVCRRVVRILPRVSASLPVRRVDSPGPSTPEREGCVMPRKGRIEPDNLTDFLSVEGVIGMCQETSREADAQLSGEVFICRRGACTKLCAAISSGYRHVVDDERMCR